MFNCYLRAKEENPKIGCMKRLKNYWDKHPEFNFLIDKNLRDQASRIEENKIVMETGYGTITTSASENMSMNIIA